MTCASNILIADKIVGRDAPPFIIAEMSGNHNQSFDRALEIVDAVAATGAHALKLQTYTAETMTVNVKNPEFYIEDTKSLWKGRYLYDLYQEAHTPWEWHAPIFDRCRKLGLICFSTAFDKSSVDFLEDLGVPCYKIASFESIDIPLIKKVAGTGKPVIISIGMSTVSEIDETVQVARDSGCKDLILLKCTSIYPAKPQNSNILTIPHLRDLFGCEVGLSDHTLGIGVSVAAVAIGATVIEKHFTLSRTDGGVDANFSLEPNEFKNLVAETIRAKDALGSISYGPTSAEINSLAFRRSLYIVKDMKAGEVITTENVRSIRPGYGMSPKFLEIVMGKKIQKKVDRGTPLDWELIG